jgi:hypothetical protein
MFSGTSLATLDTGVGANRDVIQDFDGDVIHLANIDANLTWPEIRHSHSSERMHFLPQVNCASSRMVPATPSSKATSTAILTQTSRSNCMYGVLTPVRAHVRARHEALPVPPGV